VYVENGHYGATFGVPIGALMMEQYLRGSLSESSELRAQQFEKKYLYQPFEYVVDSGQQETESRQPTTSWGQSEEQ
jgi:hypothetical protein